MKYFLRILPICLAFAGCDYDIEKSIAELQEQNVRFYPTIIRSDNQLLVDNTSAKSHIETLREKYKIYAVLDQSYWTWDVMPEANQEQTFAAGKKFLSSVIKADNIGEGQAVLLEILVKSHDHKVKVNGINNYRINKDGSDAGSVALSPKHPLLSTANLVEPTDTPESRKRLAVKAVDLLFSL